VFDEYQVRDLPRVLVLAGSSEASSLIARLSMGKRVTVISSFAGRVKGLSRPPGIVRVGGFGGSVGLARWLREEHIDAVIDATHPFTAEMPTHAAEACEATCIPRLRVVRPEWTPDLGDQWLPVPDLDHASSMLVTLRARRVFLTQGHQGLMSFSGLKGVWFLVRVIEAPDTMPLADAQVLLSRGPFNLAGEVELMRTHRIDSLVTKNSGGVATASKLTAARQLGLPVVMVTRPPAVGPVVHTVDEAFAWCTSILGLGSDG
jgi:precorrin-6A/cobalt-precorrin-6A reductase